VIRVIPTKKIQFLTLQFQLNLYLYFNDKKKNIVVITAHFNLNTKLAIFSAGFSKGNQLSQL
jgi:hypothetical protein